jgi:hypothetical protein
MLDIIVGIVLFCIFAPFAWLCILALVEWLVTRIWNKEVAASVTNWLFFAPIWVPLLVAVLAAGAWVISTIPPLFAYMLVGLFIFCNFIRQVSH